MAAKSTAKSKSKAPAKKSASKGSASKGKSTAKASAYKKSSAKPAAKKSSGRSAAAKSNSGLMKPLQPSRELAQVVGDKPLPRTEAVSKIWTHIKKYNLQNPQNRREILADDKLEPVFGKKKVTMFEMNKLLAGHLK
ncbi:MAG TPA: SWIB/MDM2 domain-containing protein [Beijerinckiaceae bacterium]|jgi:upstream activation factor subunit UAF30|nr:SWIB/MDM2 domain-containing protein [Beijerinckiaceae bacterium]